MRCIPSRILTFIAFAGTAIAQFDAGQIAGYIRDTTGASVPAASVAVINRGSQQQLKTATNADGYYIFPQLFVGAYDVAVEAKGFKKYVRTNVVLDAQAKITADIELTIGAISDSDHR